MDSAGLLADIRTCALCASQPAFYVWSRTWRLHHNQQLTQYVVSGACVDHLEEIEDRHGLEYNDYTRWPSFDFEG